MEAPEEGFRGGICRCAGARGLAPNPVWMDEQGLMAKMGNRSHGGPGETNRHPEGIGEIQREMFR
jgi:hypothetical protein